MVKFLGLRVKRQHIFTGMQDWMMNGLVAVVNTVVDVDVIVEVIVV